MNAVHFRSDAGTSWLAEGLTLSDRIKILEECAARHGVRINEKHPLTSSSFAAPWAAVYINAKRGTKGYCAVLAHELAHKLRWGTTYRSWVTVLKYISPFGHKTRREEEAFAESYETATYATVTWPSLRLDKNMDLLYTTAEVRARALGGWVWPHLTGGDRPTLLNLVASFAARLIADAREHG